MNSQLQTISGFKTPENPAAGERLAPSSQNTPVHPLLVIQGGQYWQELAERETTSSKYWCDGRDGNNL